MRDGYVSAFPFGLVNKCIFLHLQKKKKKDLHFVFVQTQSWNGEPPWRSKPKLGLLPVEHLPKLEGHLHHRGWHPLALGSRHHGNPCHTEWQGPAAWCHLGPCQPAYPVVLKNILLLEVSVLKFDIYVEWQSDSIYSGYSNPGESRSPTETKCLAPWRPEKQADQKDKLEATSSGVRQTMNHFLNTWLSYSTRSLSFPHEETRTVHENSMCSLRLWALDRVLLAPSHTLLIPGTARWHVWPMTDTQESHATFQVGVNQLESHPAFSSVLWDWQQHLLCYLDPGARTLGRKAASWTTIRHVGGVSENC